VLAEEIHWLDGSDEPDLDLAVCSRAAA